MNLYRIRSASVAELAALLEAAQTGKERPFVMRDEDGTFQFDGARIVYPRPEMAEGEAMEDEDTGEITVPLTPTGLWVCEVWLVEPDTELAALTD